MSSVASDNLASGKPFAMVAMRSSGEAFLAEFPMARVAYVIEKDLSTLDAALDGLHGPDPLAGSAAPIGGTVSEISSGCTLRMSSSGWPGTS